MRTHSPLPTQPELPMDHAPALDSAMRELFNRRWRLWHRIKDYDQAVQDPVTQRLLSLAVQHMPAAPAPKKCRR